MTQRPASSASNVPTPCSPRRWLVLGLISPRPFHPPLVDLNPAQPGPSQGNAGWTTTRILMCQNGVGPGNRPKGGPWDLSLFASFVDCRPLFPQSIFPPTIDDHCCVRIAGGGYVGDGTNPRFIQRPGCSRALKQTAKLPIQRPPFPALAREPAIARAHRSGACLPRHAHYIWSILVATFSVNPTKEAPTRRIRRYSASEATQGREIDVDHTPPVFSTIPTFGRFVLTSLLPFHPAPLDHAPSFR
ncbi:hypothetical protein C8F04DRAFT_1260870 [Mycena alexandri]|uniref:Uncharacterized protein n=1 Tax=Mycena alexandri TaxID=1745969 RepID=A0AAD6ST75_9AGAR|nr:hypothetical protein C8F04DRAFT_1260870 [Mycena alexandri]